MESFEETKNRRTTENPSKGGKKNKNKNKHQQHTEEKMPVYVKKGGAATKEVTEKGFTGPTEEWFNGNSLLLT
jgi:hypothetical protein